MAVKNIIKAIPLTNIASSSVSSSYALITASTGIPNACFLLKVINNSNEDVTLSYDGVTDADYVPKATISIINGQTNAQPNNFICNFAQGTQVWVKGTGGTGNVYVAGYYQPNPSTTGVG